MHATPAHNWLTPLSRTLYFLSALFLGLGAFIFVFGPTATLQSALGGSGPYFLKYYGLINFILFLCGITSYWLGAAFRPSASRSDTAQPVTEPRKVSKLQLYVQLGFSALILVQTVSQINMPFDLDENQRAAAAVTKSFWHEVTPFRHTEVHPVAHVAAILSMKIFGQNKIAFRLPSILFTIGFLIVLNMFAYRHLGLFASSLVFAHLAANEMIVWYMHAMRGYISAMFITGILMYLLADFVKQQSPRPRKLLFGLAFALSAVTHPFTGIFSLLLILSLSQWLYLNRRSLSNEKRKYGAQIVIIAVALLPLFLGVFVTTLRSLEPIANIHAGGFEGFVGPLFQTLPALGSGWAVRMLAAIIIIAAVANFVNARKIKAEFFTLFVANSFVFYAAVLSLLKVSHLEPRWFIPFLVPFVFWLGDWVAGVSQRSLKIALMVGSFLLLTVIPLKMRSAIYDRLGILYHARYENFLEELKLATAPVEENCYKFPDMPMGHWAEVFHIPSAKQKKPCKNTYLISLERSPIFPDEAARIVVDTGRNYVAYQLNEKKDSKH